MKGRDGQGPQVALHLLYSFPECVAKGSRLTLWGSGGRALFATRCVYVRNRPQPFATVRNRPQPFATVRNRSR